MTLRLLVVMELSVEFASVSPLLCVPERQSCIFFFNLSNNYNQLLSQVNKTIVFFTFFLPSSTPPVLFNRQIQSHTFNGINTLG